MFLRMEPTDVTRVFNATAWDVNGPIDSWTAQLEEEALIRPDASQISDDQLQAVGRQLFESVFPGAIGEQMRRMLQKWMRLVVDVSSGAESVSRVPWETLISDTGPAVWEGRLHVIRYLRSEPKDVVIRIPGTDVIRLLAVFPEGPSQGEATHVLERLLRPAADRGMLRYSLLGGTVTSEQLRDEMRKQRPNVFHLRPRGVRGAS